MLKITNKYLSFDAWIAKRLYSGCLLFQENHWNVRISTPTTLKKYLGFRRGKGVHFNHICLHSHTNHLRGFQECPPLPQKTPLVNCKRHKSVLVYQGSETWANRIQRSSSSQSPLVQAANATATKTRTQVLLPSYYFVRARWRKLEGKVAGQDTHEILTNVSLPWNT